MCLVFPFTCPVAHPVSWKGAVDPVTGSADLGHPGPHRGLHLAGCGMLASDWNLCGRPAAVFLPGIPVQETLEGSAWVTVAGSITADGEDQAPAGP